MATAAKSIHTILAECDSADDVLARVPQVRVCGADELCAAVRAVTARFADEDGNVGMTGHQILDELLLRYIGDADVSRAFHHAGKWYA